MKSALAEQNGCVGVTKTDLSSSAYAACQTKESKNFSFEIKQDSLTEEGHFEGHASVFGNVDLDDDIIERGAFTKTLLSGRNIVVLSQHDHRRPIGRITEAREDDFGLFVKGQLSIGVQEADETRINMKNGVLDRFSIGFMIQDSEFDKDRGVRIIKEVDLFEVSIVTFPANPAARISEVKEATLLQLPVAPRDAEWDSATAIANIKKFTGSEDAPSDTYSKGVLWMDVNNKDAFSAYKLPFADVIDGKLTIVPKGLSAAKVALAGAHGDMNIPASDVPSVKRLIERYEARINEVLGDESDDAAKALVIEDIASLKDGERFLRTAGFSKKASTAFVSRLKSIASDDASATKQSGETLSDSVADDSIVKAIDEINARLTRNLINNKIKEIRNVQRDTREVR